MNSSIDSLVAALRDDPAGPHLTGFVRMRGAWSNDVDADAAAGNQDLAGFSLDNVRLILTGEAGSGCAYTVSLEGGEQLGFDTATTTGVGLMDAFATIALGESSAIVVGRFSSTTLWSTCIDERSLLFLERPFLSEASDNRDLGVELSTTLGSWHAYATAQNGVDGRGEDFVLSARVAFDAWDTAPSVREGAYDTPPRALDLGVYWLDDQGLDDGRAIGGDVFFRHGAWSAQAEITDFGDDLRPAGALNTSTGTLVPIGAQISDVATPWDASIAYLLPSQRWEIAARYQDLDDDSDTSIVSACVNRYVAGHDVKWTLQFDHSNSDVDAAESDAAAIGLTVGF